MCAAEARDPMRHIKRTRAGRPFRRCPKGAGDDGIEPRPLRLRRSNTYGAGRPWRAPVIHEPTNMQSLRISRRNLARALAVAPLIPLPVLAAAAPLNLRRPLMGTWVDITIADGDRPGARRAAEQAFAEMERLAGLMSAFDPQSRLGAINRAAGRHPVPVPPELMAVLLQAREVHARSAGAFDATVGRLTPGPAQAGIAVADEATVRSALRHVGMRHLQLDLQRGTAALDDPMTRLDLGGIAKLPILEAGLERLRAAGTGGAMINGGGDVLASVRADGRPWRIGVRDAAAPDRLLAVLPLREGVVASSGDYERFVMHEGRRYHHVIDPATGRPTRGIHGVTLVGARAAEVNGLGTAAMVAGPQRAAALLERCGVAQALFVREGGGAWVSPALAGRLEMLPRAA